jgi:hypothetical protein
LPIAVASIGPQRTGRFIDHRRQFVEKLIADPAANDVEQLNFRIQR